VTLDANAMSRLLEITGGDVVFVDELVDTFLDDATVQLDALHVAGSANDAAAIVRPAHSLKSNSDNVGATVLADLCRALEADGRAGHVPEMAERIAAIETEFLSVRAALLETRGAR
jgi:HPt (histidine-containing phosphotransfer) domain-containing protein